MAITKAGIDGASKAMADLAMRSAADYLYGRGVAYTERLGQRVVDLMRSELKAKFDEIMDDAAKARRVSDDLAASTVVASLRCVGIHAARGACAEIGL